VQVMNPDHEKRKIRGCLFARFSIVRRIREVAGPVTKTRST
jgi:hypothetical protein